MNPVGARLAPTFLERGVARLRYLRVPNTVEFIDLSKWNTVLDWAALAASEVKAVLLRATFGPQGIDSKFVENATQAHAHGMLVMTYHYQYTNYSAIDQANHHWNVIEPLFEMLGYVPVVIDDEEDIEPGITNSQRIQGMGEFLYTIEDKQGVPGRAGVYSSPGYANQYLSPAPYWINDFIQHVAHWHSGPLPTPPKGWKPVPEYHQYGIWNDYPWCDPVAGCKNDIDRDRFFGTYQDLYELLTGQPYDPTDPPPEPPIEPPPGEIVTHPPKPVSWAKVVNPRGSNVRSKAAANQPIVGGLAENTVVPVFERIDKPNGEVWLHIRIPDTQILGWVAQYYPDYSNPTLLVFVPPPE